MRREVATAQAEALAVIKRVEQRMLELETHIAALQRRGFVEHCGTWAEGTKYRKVRS
jgi:hypothetical protein